MVLCNAFCVDMYAKCVFAVYHVNSNSINVYLTLSFYLSDGSEGPEGEPHPVKS